MKGNELKPRIGIFGRRNYGKSSLINFLTGQELAIVSPVAGATTDPVRKTMELGGIGPVVWIDTAGLDDSGELGRMRVEKSLAELAQVDLAIILLSENKFETPEQHLLDMCRDRKIPFLLVYALADLFPPEEAFLNAMEELSGQRPLVLSIYNNDSREALLSLVRDALPESSYRHGSLLGDVVSEGDHVVLVTPIDSSAPEGRLILPQVQVIRDLLDNQAVAHVCQVEQLQQTLNALAHPPRLVVTDSQAFARVAAIVPENVFLTSFSVVLARAKGLFADYVKGTPTLDHLKDGDKILLLESCTHNVTCEDIGRVKLPMLIRRHSGRQLLFDVVAGLSALQHPVTDYALVIQCGGCVVSPKQLLARLAPAIDAGVPVSNYGLALAYINGIFNRSMKIFNQ